eukprot:scaffold281093_cov30-Tisochrysis_lutea.AAC.3
MGRSGDLRDTVVGSARCAQPSTHTPIPGPPTRPGAYDHAGKDVERRKLQDMANVAMHKRGWGGAPRFYTDRMVKSPGPGDYRLPSAIGGTNPEGRM